MCQLVIYTYCSVLLLFAIGTQATIVSMFAKSGCDVTFGQLTPNKHNSTKPVVMCCARNCYSNNKLVTYQLDCNVKHMNHSDCAQIAFKVKRSEETLIPDPETSQWPKPIMWIIYYVKIVAGWLAVRLANLLRAELIASLGS